jgi:transcriptional regulator with XRE-family HTH domain
MGGKAESFGAHLRAARSAAGLSQSELSERSGLPKPTLSRYENGHVLPSLQTLRKLAEALQVSELSLLPGTTPEQDFYEALRAHGIEVHSTSEAQHLADAVRDAMRDEEEDETG